MFNCTLPVTAIWSINRLYLFTVTKKKYQHVCKAVFERWLKPLACCDTGKCEVMLRQTVFGRVYFEAIMLHSTKQVCLHSVSAFFFLTLHFSRAQRCKSEHLKRRHIFNFLFYFLVRHQISKHFWNKKISEPPKQKLFSEVPMLWLHSLLVGFIFMRTHVRLSIVLQGKRKMDSRKVELNDWVLGKILF